MHFLLDASVFIASGNADLCDAVRCFYDDEDSILSAVGIESDTETKHLKNPTEQTQALRVRFWRGLSKKVATRTWLNWTRSRPSLTRSVGGGYSVNFNPRYGVSQRFRRGWP